MQGYLLPPPDPPRPPAQPPPPSRRPVVMRRSSQSVFFQGYSRIAGRGAQFVSFLFSLLLFLLLDLSEQGVGAAVGTALAEPGQADPGREEGRNMKAFPDNDDCHLPHKTSANRRERQRKNGKKVLWGTSYVVRTWHQRICNQSKIHALMSS